MRVISFLLLLLLEPCLGCLRVEFTSGSLGTLSFDQLPIEYQYSPDEVKTGRPTYFNEEHQLYMYHIIMNKERGRWIVSNSINPEGLGNAIAYIESWAVVPYLTKEITDTKDWNIFWKKLDDWGPDPATRVTCEIDETVYFESHPKVAPELAAFYVQRVSQSQQTEYPIYTQIKPSPDAKQYYLYKLDGKWLFGDELGIDSCLSFVKSEARTASTIFEEEINFYDHDARRWSQLASKVVSVNEPAEKGLISREFESVYYALRYRRALKALPEGQQYYELRNLMPMPVVGLGTGGLWREQTAEVMKMAIDEGYRLMDLAREYGNEHIVPEVLSAYQGVLRGAGSIKRSDLFLETKVWPTQLGFEPTNRAIAESLHSMQTHYINLYLLHWPKCNPEIEWMHCETTEDPAGTWQGSWRALEKAYAEGRVDSIGVSNFDLPLLQSMQDEGKEVSVLPHVLQNWAEPGSRDDDVMEWCKETKTIFQTYATMRNLRQLSTGKRDEVSAAMKRLAGKYWKTPHGVALRLMVQSGMAVIPRASSLEHLRENLKVFDWEILSDEVDELWGRKR